MNSAGSGTIPASDADTAELAAGAEVNPVHQQATIDVSPTGPSLRWTAFEDTLRQRREDVLQSSIDNVKREDEKRAADRERLERRRAS